MNNAIITLNNLLWAMVDHIKHTHNCHKKKRQCWIHLGFFFLPRVISLYVQFEFKNWRLMWANVIVWTCTVFIVVFNTTHNTTVSYCSFNLIHIVFLLKSSFMGLLSKLHSFVTSSLYHTDKQCKQCSWNL